MSVAFSPDSTFLISGLADNTLRIKIDQIGEAVGISLTGHIGPIRSVFFSHLSVASLCPDI